MNKAQKSMKYWWFPLLFGIIFILLGVWILRAPAESMGTLSKLIGAILLVSGTAQLVLTYNHRTGIPGWGFQLGGGIIDLVIGIVLIVNPEILLNIITIFVGIWLVINGITMVMKSTESRKEGKSYWTGEMVWGISLMLLAILFFWHPVILGITIAIWTALAFIFLGFFRIFLTFRMRQMRIREQ
jgi:uncharacterized membrane protein HdeD (DUF308 family)